MEFKIPLWAFTAVVADLKPTQRIRLLSLVDLCQKEAGSINEQLLIIGWLYDKYDWYGRIHNRLDRDRPG